MTDINPQSIAQIILRGEDSRTQFKRQIDADSLCAEMAAFSNFQGGLLIIGVNDNGSIAGLEAIEIQKLNNDISNVATQKITPPIYPTTAIVEIENKLVLVIEIQKGSAKPYSTNKGVYWTKVGADKGRLSREELLRLFQETGSVTADEIPVFGTNCESDLDRPYFYAYFEQYYRSTIEDQAMPLSQLLENMGLAQNGLFTLAGLLLFGKNIERFRSSFQIKAVSFYGNSITETAYKSSIDISGNLESQFRGAMSFLKNNLNFIQGNQGFNSNGKLEIAEIALEEIVQNALLHRDYTKNSAIKVLIFEDRVEIISPGKLPNHLTIERIKNGNSVVRNNVLVSFGGRIIPYRGLGSGIRRVLENHPNTDFINDIDGEQFTVILKR
jgi:ATP-dependent DNA helicase RecG